MMDVERDMEPYVDKDPGSITATVSWEKNPDMTMTIERRSRELLVDDIWKHMVRFYKYYNIEKVIDQRGWKLMVENFDLSHSVDCEYHETWIAFKNCVELKKVSELLVEISMIMDSNNPLTIKVTYPDKEAYINSKLCVIS